MDFGKSSRKQEGLAKSSFLNIMENLIAIINIFNYGNKAIIPKSF